MTAAVAGCIGGDDDPSDAMPGHNDDDGNGNETKTNETKEPAPLPVPKIGVQMEIVGNGSQDPPFIVPPGSELEFTLDGSESTIENGSIERFAWHVLRADGREEQGTFGGDEPTFTFTVNGTDSQTDYGVYTATLRAMSDRGELGEAATQFVLSYSNTFSEENTMFGPSPNGCDGPGQQKGEGEIPETGVAMGTYREHNFKVNDNASSIDLSLDFESTDGADVVLYLYGPGSNITADDCSGALAESDASGSPVTLEASELGGPGSYSVRVQLVGFVLGPYAMDATVLYDIPGGADDGDDGDEGDE